MNFVDSVDELDGRKLCSNGMLWLFRREPFRFSENLPSCVKSWYFMGPRPFKFDIRRHQFLSNILCVREQKSLSWKEDEEDRCRV